MVIRRGEVYWADLGEPIGSRPANRRPVVVVQAQTFNGSGLGSVVVVAVTSNTRLAMMPGNVFLPAVAAGIERDSVVNVTALTTLDKGELDGPVGWLPTDIMAEIDQGLRRVLDL